MASALSACLNPAVLANPASTQTLLLQATNISTISKNTVNVEHFRFSEILKLFNREYYILSLKALELGYRIPPLVSILSPGELGSGLAYMLRTHRYTVGTCVVGRSADTVKRAKDAGFHCYPTDEDMFAESSYILSIIPPQDAMAVAERIAIAAENYANQEHPEDSKPPRPIYFLELNAISPTTARKMAAMFSNINEKLKDNKNARRIVFIDGSIMGGPPHMNPRDGVWTVPRILLSGPEFLSTTAFNEFSVSSVGDDADTLVEDEEDDGEMFEQLLQIKWVGNEIGQASGLRMCFSSLTKGLTALAIQSFTTAASLNLLKPFQDELSLLSPQIHQFVTRSLTKMPPKAYRWVGEMDEVAETFSSQVGFDKDVYHGAAEVFRVICGETILGDERTHKRTRGQDVEDVANLMLEGMMARRQKQGGVDATEKTSNGEGKTGLENKVEGMKLEDPHSKEAFDHHPVTSFLPKDY